VMAYTLSVDAYQIGMLASAPLASLATIGAVAIVQVACFAALIRWGRGRLRPTVLIPLVRVG
jgi:hypothetical protein